MGQPDMRVRIRAEDGIESKRSFVAQPSPSRPSQTSPVLLPMTLKPFHLYDKETATAYAIKPNKGKTSQGDDEMSGYQPTSLCKERRQKEIIEIIKHKEIRNF
jgi:hypothetical protein